MLHPVLPQERDQFSESKLRSAKDAARVILFRLSALQHDYDYRFLMDIHARRPAVL
jgi:hypothetical protein